jgi:hypothetical protein
LLDRTLAENLGPACGQRVGLMTRAAARQVDSGAAHKPSPVAQSLPSTSGCLKSLFIFILISENMIRSCHDGIGLFFEWINRTRGAD